MRHVRSCEKTPDALLRASSSAAVPLDLTPHETLELRKQEASIALTQFGAVPDSILITTYTVDYTGDGGNGWLYNMLDGATDGSGVSPVDLFGYVQLDLPTSLAPNHTSHLRTF